MGLKTRNQEYIQALTLKYKEKIKQGIKQRELEQNLNGASFSGKDYLCEFPADPEMKKSASQEKEEDFTGYKGQQKLKRLELEKRINNMYIMDSLEKRGENVVWDEKTKEV